MNSITLLKGFLLSKHIHSLHAPLIFAVSMVFICHSAIAMNKPDKLPGSDEGGGNRYTTTINQRIPGNQNIINYSISQNNYTSFPSYSSKVPAATDGGNKLESFYAKLQSYGVLAKVQAQVNATKEDFNLFLNYYRDKIFADDRSTFWKMVENNQIQNDDDIQNYANQQIASYVELYQKFLQIKKDYPSSVAEHSAAARLAPAVTCNPACDNIDFENGTLSAWSAYYATNMSTNFAFRNSSLIGGACGAVTQSAGPDPNTNNDYQVQIMSGPGLDPVAGSFIPVVCPIGGSYSVRIGDSTRNGAQMGILQQTFTVTNSNANFEYMYAVVLENPGHTYYQQPYFNVQMLDQNGNPIPNCGNYSVVSGPGLPGYRAIYYPRDRDTVYCKPWTTIFVPLQQYIGQCITVKITAADCALGGHFGYAYFDATCLSNTIIATPLTCNSNATLTAPAGVSTYQWSGPCIVGPTNTQSITISCGGTYKVILSSAVNAPCADTLSINIPAPVLPVVNITSANITCGGRNTGSATANVSSGTPPYTYSWSNGGTSATISNLSAGTYTVTVHDANSCSVTASVTITQPPVLTVSAVADSNVRCYGDNNAAATATANGGTPAYTYSWSNGGTAALDRNLTAGTYTVTVTDANGCQATASVTITQPPQLAVTISSHHNPTCHGDNHGAAVASASGGTPNYNYLWSNGQHSPSASSLTAGVYWVTVTDANGCTATDTIIISQPAAIVVATASVTNVSCNGGSNGTATVNPTGGTSPYSYSWNTTPPQRNATATGLSAGTYIVTVTDANGCTGTDTVIITQPPVLTAAITSSVNISCYNANNGSATVTAGGGTPAYTYNWSNGGTSATDNNLSAGTYTITVRDAHNCSATASVTVTQPAAALTATISGVSNVSCFAGNNGSATANVSGGTPTYTYNWSNGGTSATENNLSAGTYTITVTDAHNCSVTASVTITQPTAALAATISGVSNVSCFANNNGSATVNVTGGTPTYTYNWSNGGTSATENNLSAGTYTITVTDAHNCSATASVTITQPAAALAATISGVTNVSCFSGNNGSATVNVTGGTPNYTYNWSNGGTSATENNLSAGTYTITVTDAHNCSATASVTITQPAAALAATISGVSNVSCFAGNNGSATANVTGGTPAYTYNWSNGGTSATENNLSAGTYTITITDAHNCSATASVTITQPATALAATATVSSNVSCNGGSNGSATVNVTGGTPTYTYNWSNGGTNATENNLSAGTYTITITDAHNCSATASVTITQPAAALAVNPTVSSNVSCFNGNNGSATANVSGGTPNYTYSWSNGGTNATENNLVASTYTITVTDAHGCQVTASVTITQPAAALAVNPTVSSNVSCFNGNNGSATANVSGGTPAYTYSWSNGGTSATENNLVAGTYTITVTDAHGCQSTASVTITQPADPLTVTGTATANVSCHNGNNGSATANILGGTPGYTYNWSNGGTNAIDNNLSAGTYTITVTDAHNCSATASVTITQPAAALGVNITINSNITCNANNNGSATANVFGGTPGYTYSWSNGNTSASVSNLSAGTYTLNVTDAHGCTNSASATITQPTALVASAGSVVNVSCYGGNNGSASLTVTGGSSPYNYAWSNSATSNSISNLTAGTYSVTVTDAHGCTGTTSVTITQPARIITTVTGPDTICGGAAATLTASSTGGSGTYFYQWSNGGGPGNTINVSPASPTTYTVAATDRNGCRGDTASITIVPLILTSADVNISPAQTICNGDSVNIFASVNGQNTGNYTVTWNINSFSGLGPFKVSPSTTTTYSVTIRNTCGSIVTKSVTITVNPLPVINIPHQSGAACNAVTLNFRDTNAANAGSSYQWNFGDHTGSTLASPSHTYDQSGRYIITVMVTSRQGCSSNAQNFVDINIYPSSSAHFTANPNSAGVVNPVIAFTDNSANTTQWAWDFGDGGTSVLQNPTHTYASRVAGYKVHLVTTNNYGCPDSADDSVHIVPDFRIFIPNAFSPNEDDINDYFTAKGIGIQTFNMLIFDRWGNLLFTTNDINKGWDGRVHKANATNEVCQEDTYVYKIEVTDVFNLSHQYIGAVTLIK